jgi:WG containing repeat
MGTGRFSAEEVAEWPIRFHHFDQPFLVGIGDKDGFIDAGCRMVIPAQYSEAFDFTEGLTAIKVGQKWGYIDQTEAMVVRPQFAVAFHSPTA